MTLTSSLLTASVIISLLLHVSSAASTDSFSCPTGTSCSCGNFYDEFHIECPNLHPTVLMRINPTKRTAIECDTKNEDYFSTLPVLKIGDIQTIEISRCPLTKDRPIVKTIERLGITKFRALFFKSYGISNGVTLERKHLQGLHDLERLLLSRNGLTDLPEDLFNDITNITWLDLQQNKVHLPRNIFAKLEKLQYLELGHNNLETIQPGLFANQKNLKLLNIWGNNFKNLTMDSFEGLVSLTELDISSSNIETFESDVFDHLKNLTTLTIINNSIRELPSGLLTLNEKLQKFKLIHNRVNLTKIPDGFFSNNTHLQELNIQAGVIEMGDNVFEGCTSLVNMTLSNNYFSALATNTFTDLINLQRLDLSRNQLESIEGLFRNTMNIITLNLADNKIRNITMSTFKDLTNLRTLIMSNNNLHQIHPNAFEKTKFLEYVNMENNHLTLRPNNEETSPFHMCLNLKTLNLRRNEITTIFQDWTLSLLALRDLDLSYNKISALSIDDIFFTSHAINFNVSNNLIPELSLRELEMRSKDQKENNQGKNTDINVYIDNNPFICDCVAMHLVKYLKMKAMPGSEQFINIDADNLKCTSPPNLVGRSVGSLEMKELLCVLDYPGTAIKKCPDGCICNVRTYDLAIIVDCSNLRLTEIPMLPNPRPMGLEFIELNIGNNYITNLPLATTPGYAEVHELNVSFNNISRLGIEQIPKNLSVLDIRANHFQELNFTIFNDSNVKRNLKLLALSRNPWKCDCESVEFLHYVQGNYEKISDYKNMTCSNGRLLSDSLQDDFCENERNVIVTVSIILAVLGLIVGTLVALFYKYRDYVMVWCHAHNIRIFAEETIDENKKYDAFISYSHKDEDFIIDHLKPTLENGPTPFKLCLHIRDWVIGEFIPTQIANSIEESRRTIVVLSPNFLESAWGKWEFLTAHTNAMKEGRARVIVIIYGDLGDESKLDPAIRSYLKTNTYIKWGDSWFWDRLRYAMPHHKSREKSRGLFKSSADDKLELIIPSPINSPHTTPVVETYANNSALNGSFSDKSMNGNGHVNGAFIINTNSKQSDV